MVRGLPDIYVQGPLTPAWSRLVELVPEITGCSVDINPGLMWTFDGYNMDVPLCDVEGLLHELCHWIVATNDERVLPDYGIPEMSREDGELREREACLLESLLYGRANMERPRKSSCADYGKPLLESQQERALARLEELSANQVQLVVEAIQLPGGGSSRY